MLALVDLHVFVYTSHTSSLFDQNMRHYIFKYFCNNFLLPAKPHLQKQTPLESPWHTLTFVTSSVNHQSPKISQTMDNGTYLPLSWALAHNSITYFTQYQLTQCSITIACSCYVRNEPAIVCKCSTERYIVTYTIVHCLAYLGWLVIDWWGHKSQR